MGECGPWLLYVRASMYPDLGPHKLRFVRPNCAAQLDANAGRNRGRVPKKDLIDGSVALVVKGERTVYIIAKAGNAVAEKHTAMIINYE